MAALPWEERRSRVRSFHFEKDRLLCLGAGWLMMKGLGILRESELRFGENGKPFAPGYPAFNLSHSGEWVLLAVDDNDVGCDIEQVRFVNGLRMGRIVFTDRELREIENARDKTGVFFDLWTKKEALLKCMGKGFHREAKSVEVCSGLFRDGEEAYYLRTRRFADYTLSVCSRKREFSVEPEFVDLGKI